MAKKIKFPLILKNDAQARTLEELQENFEFDRIYDYFVSGKLLTWLKDRYYEEESEQIDCLTGEEADLQKRIYEIFGIPFAEENLSDLEIKRRNREKYEKIRLYTDDEEILANLDRVAMNQEELADLLDEEYQTIHLFEGTYKIPLSRTGVNYCGIGLVTVQISSKVDVDLKKLGIEFKNITLSCKNEIEIRMQKHEGVECIGSASYIMEDMQDDFEVSLECVITYETSFDTQDDTYYTLYTAPVKQSERSKGPGAVALIKTSQTTGETVILDLLTYIDNVIVTRNGCSKTEEYDLPFLCGASSSIDPNDLLRFCDRWYSQYQNNIYYIKNCLEADEQTKGHRKNYDSSALCCISLDGACRQVVLHNTDIFAYIKSNCGYQASDMRFWGKLLLKEIIVLSEKKMIMNVHITSGMGSSSVIASFLLMLNLENKAINILAKAQYREFVIILSDDRKIIYGGGNEKNIILYNFVDEYTAVLAEDIEWDFDEEKMRYPVTIKDDELYYIKSVPGSVSYVRVLFKVNLEDNVVVKIKELPSFAPKGTYKYPRALFEWKEENLYMICPYGYAMWPDGEEKMQIF